MNEESTPSEKFPGIGLRQMVLSTSPRKLGFVTDSNYPTVYGVLTDWDLGGLFASIMSMRDGTASLYTTSTFGIIGGQGHEKVRQAAERYVKTAESFCEAGKIVSEFAYPKNNQVFYCVMTYNGIRRIIADGAAIEQGPDPTLPLFTAAQDVLTELRQTMDTNPQA